ncbi:MAG: hypothetical protein COZ75_06670 [Flavobacteriaceae bacterium CG_4_8_14_3_um_filter_34_10]|nr:MAG: hypothetical protein AUK33_01930 [Flavobacteriaceae bacterium CG2_30_34_30]PIQ17662.1 MAG: hypothetical protein COW66_10440 [Flavobacteriaceae bacterium CG18_big_fil_WC_8_21_14_2_50_34_36]PIV51406.1 MAG: hypothetical protein COS19_01375 [Flavobacteriaceae bacterium CG02_land_8_20_14_3_00_34_13]PIX09460.1 MAG: hypothetical protein COZ75_06670 [Flavobacteriaceae bacterium CG_4_8_14_3_um_filter_34_10]PIZ06977.1 MAG: hypothetical protein COY56_11370 [Flavobacteriaceae bacterium CG_4_10_14_0
MRTFKSHFVEATSIGMLLLVSVSLLYLQSCKDDKKETLPESVEIENQNVIEIVTANMDFQMPDTIPSGWNTFRYKNLSPQTHFFLIDKYPEGKTSEDAEKIVAPVFDSAMKLIMEGKSEEGYAEFAKLPKWFSEVVFVGGSGLLSPNQVGETTLHLKPGKYILECYVKMSNGVFHTSMGMTKDIVVTPTDSGNYEWISDIDITISSTDGIVFNDTISAGKQVFSVFYKDQIVYENFVGHDINLVKMDEHTNLNELENWMNWADPKGLIEPAPKGFTFMGGVNDMPEGSIGFFSATLEPGNYALISEVPNSLSKNLLKTFVIPK